ncbi:MAG: energy-coupling factor ABC transporter ATP-binding protein [Aigarchaeota archaeon]|nr:energy-coupling factor ABC transporter ATP-binding protein [Aigarchaeota archaeon]MCX8193620.1 energy-coupling factor ABC transporter ATP-binding protein [Nitrososphaeria archaeon]MDW7987020.1 ABC transporter ATP-binding protein [Nitrososphaerota archaeon]
MIIFENVEYTYPNGFKALSSINLEIKDGELVALMGENGAGKTTLLKHLNGLLKPSSGRVIVNGVDTRHATVASLSRDVGIVFQNAEDMFFSPTVWEEISFALHNFGYQEEVIKKRVGWALKFMELEDYRDKSPFLLSGGEKKRLALAIVLAWSPKIVALDEPTVGQDVLQKEKMIQIIRQANQQGKTIIISSHDVEFIADLQPRIILMSKGKIIKDGYAEEVLTDLSLLKECRLIPPQMVSLTYELGFLGIKPHLGQPEDIALEIIRRLR